mmetsp:Transcript_34402/g.43928  ORF Transcript_34402/g.43928 Transcript_34402/m.43928 type:complete len:482 (+) Transcript_34402:118-1563(+)
MKKVLKNKSKFPPGTSPRGSKRLKTFKEDPLSVSHKLKIHKLSNLNQNVKDWNDGYNLWKDLFERGFALLRVDFAPIHFRHIESRISNSATNESYDGLHEEEDKKVYFHRVSENSSRILDPELESALDSNFNQLVSASHEVFNAILGSNLSTYILDYQKGIDSAFKATQSKIISSASDLNSKTSSRCRILSTLYKNLEKLRSIEGPLNNLANSTKEVDNDILFKCPPKHGEISPDYLSISKFTGGGENEHTDLGLLSLIFRERPNPLIPGGLEVFTKNGTWYEVEKDICNGGNICVILPGHQMELLSQGVIKATQHRINECFGTSTTFSLHAAESAFINGTPVSRINSEWMKSQRAKQHLSLTEKIKEMDIPGFGIAKTHSILSSPNEEFTQTSCNPDIDVDVKNKLILNPQHSFFDRIVGHNASIEDYWTTRGSPLESSEESSFSDEEDFVFYDTQQEYEFKFLPVEDDSMKAANFEFLF